MKRLPREISHCGRGRPHGHRQSVTELSNRWYLIWISQKYGLEPREFLACFLEAWMHERSSCNGVSVQCRQKTEKNGVFLVTRDQQVIAQLSLSDTALKRLSEVDLGHFPWNGSTLNERIDSPGPVDMKIQDVSARVKWVNLRARVVDKSVPRRIFSRFGVSHSLSTATISDSTGCIKLPLWNAQIDMVSVGDTVQIDNGRVKAYRGELQVSVGKNGRLNVIRKL